MLNCDSLHALLVGVHVSQHYTYTLQTLVCENPSCVLTVPMCVRCALTGGHTGIVTKCMWLGHHDNRTPQSMLRAEWRHWPLHARVFMYVYSMCATWRINCWSSWMCWSMLCVRETHRKWQKKQKTKTKEEKEKTATTVKGCRRQTESEIKRFKESVVTLVFQLYNMSKDTHIHTHTEHTHSTRELYSLSYTQ